MKQKNQILTSVKIDEELWENFRISCIKRKFSFQKLSERAVSLYLNNEQFRKIITNYKL